MSGVGLDWDTMDQLLLIDDDVELCTMLIDYLSRHGYGVTATHRGDAGLQAAKTGSWSLILLDVMLPGLDGLEVLRELRKSSSANVLLLTARGEDVDRIVGLELGADDYLPKPFNARELVARIRAILRRSTNAPSSTAAATLIVEDLRLDVASRSVHQSGQKVDLTAVEFALLEALMRSPGVVVTKDELAEHALGRAFHPLDRSLDMHVSRLRRKLGEGSLQEDRVKTIRGAGYQLAVGGQATKGKN